MKTLPHRTLKITEKLLYTYAACIAGKERAIARGLPVTISTDPEENIELACQIIGEVDESGCVGPACDVLWLADVLTNAQYDCLYSRDYGYDLDPAASDPYYLAQILAQAADGYFRRRGK